MSRLIHSYLLLCSILLLFSSCATTQYKAYETDNNMFKGKGGTKVVVNGIEFWDNGDPPRQFKVLGIIDDQRPGGLIPMSQLRNDIVKKAQEAGGDAVVQLSNQSQLAGFYSSGSASASLYSNLATASGSSMAIPVRRNVAKFAVIQYLD